MARLKDMVINVVPKLDINKARRQAAMLGNAFKKSMDGVRKSMSFLGKGVTAMNQGLQLAKAVGNVVDATKKQVDDLMGFSDNIADTAAMAGISTDRLLGLVSGLSGGMRIENGQISGAVGGASSLENTVKMLEKFIQRSEENGLPLEDAANEMVNALKLINSQGSQAEKTRLTQEFFGTRSVKDVQDLLTGVKDFEKNRWSAAQSEEFADAVNKGEQEASRRSNISSLQNLINTKTASKNGLFAAANNGEIDKANANIGTLAKADAQSLSDITSGLSQLEETFKGGVNQLLGGLTKILGAMMGGRSK
ncbi:MAG: hypothetical protein ACRCVN_05975 [Spirochaetia bacterium]